MTHPEGMSYSEMKQEEQRKARMTIQDPFAAPADEPQTAPEPPQEEKPAAGSVYVDVKPRFSEDFPSGNKIVQTYKEGTGFDSSWVVVHSDTVKDALEITYNPEFKELLDRTKLIAAGFRGGSAPTQSASPQRQAPQGATEAPAWAGAAPAGYKYATGAKNGRVWHAWFPIERDGGEKIWLNPPK